MKQKNPAAKGDSQKPAVLNDGYRTYGDYGGFKVTQEVFLGTSAKKMVCLTTGEKVSRKQLKERSKMTWLKITELSSAIALILCMLT